jgi:hypothetical protein
MRNYLFLLFALGIISCSVGKEGFNLKPSRIIKPEFTKQIRLDGLYFGIFPDQENKMRLFLFFFYNNGICSLSGFASDNFKSNSGIDSILAFCKRNYSEEKKFESSFDYGGFTRKEKNIEVQVLRYVSQFKWSTCSFQGRIINDTTLFMSNCDFQARPNFCVDSFYLHFKKTEKIDSAKNNNWINKSWYWSNN